MDYQGLAALIISLLPELTSNRKMNICETCLLVIKKYLLFCWIMARKITVTNNFRIYYIVKNYAQKLLNDLVNQLW